MSASRMDEDLLASARVARELALVHCRSAIGGDCTWYHGVWQYLRALGVAKGAGGQGAFLGDTLRALAAAGGVRRVLVSGTADDAMPLVALAAFRDAGMPLDLAVVDRCETPLALTRWSAARVGAAPTTVRADILDFESGSPFDLVMTNSFLGYFDATARRRLFARWAGLLRRGGRLLFTNRLRPEELRVRAGFGDEAARLFCAAARLRAEQQQRALGVDPAVLEGWVRDYTTRFESFPVHSVEEVLELLRVAGFVPERVDTALFVGAHDGARVAGPSSAESASYVRVLAARR